MKQPGLYLHIPFCRRKCPYCDFYSLANTSLIPEWLEVLTSEMALYRGRFGTFGTLYLGGGTPSLLPGSALETLMARVHQYFSLVSEAEISIEANPTDLIPERVSLLKSLGFNRISVGVQSFDNGELSFLGRQHKARDAVEAVTRIREAGFANVGMDLIYGLPGQDMARWFDTLKTAVSFTPEHLSCYQLTIEKGTLFSRMKENGDLTPIGEDLEEAFFLRTSRFLTDRGYVHYEISNFSRGREHACRHNQKYWDHTPYLGLGPSAHSFQDDRRWWNIRSVRKYCGALRSGKTPVEEEEVLSPAQLHLESVALGLRTKEGFDHSEIHEATARKRLEELEAAGFLLREGCRVVPTMKGFLVAEHLPLHLCGEGQP